MKMTTRRFDDPGLYRACLAAEEYVRNEGYEVAHMEAGCPRGIAKRRPKRWSELSDAERDRLAGILMGDMRRGPVEVWIDEEVAR